MPIVFDEISGEVTPPRGGQREAAPSGRGEKPACDPAETVRHELQLAKERQCRLKAD